jgi:thymidine kinase
MANLDIIFGPMFAGKSCELIKRIRQLKVIERKYIVVKPIIDNRYENNMIVSHNFEKEDCIALHLLQDIFNYDINNVHSIFIDEAQFFTDLKENVLKLVENYNINVVITGLDGDSNRNKFGQIIDLIPFSTSCIKLKACCLICKDGTPAIFTHRKVDNNEQILIGNNEQFISVCRTHYLKLNNNLTADCLI